MSPTTEAGTTALPARHGSFAGAFAHPASPVLIGLVGAVLGMWLLAPSALADGRALASVLLMPLLFASVAIYSWTVFNPGDYVGLVIDTDRRTLDLIQSNPFAERRTTVGFDAVACLSLEERADETGKTKLCTVVNLRNGETVALAMRLDDGHVNEIKRLIKTQG